MTAWRDHKEVDELPKVNEDWKTDEFWTLYETPDGNVWFYNQNEMQWEIMIPAELKDDHGSRN